MISDNIIREIIIKIIYVLLEICLITFIICGIFVCLVHMYNYYYNICNICRRRNFLEYEQIDENLDAYD